MRARILIVLVVALVTGVAAALAQTTNDTSLAARQAAVDAFKGTWTGTSTCTDPNRPACKNEVVVYRFVPFTGAPWQLRCLADKIVGGKRLPMGAFLFQYDDKAKELRCDFKKGNTHGLWSFTADGDSLRGSLVLLPDGNKGRDVRAHRVDDAHVPPAPALKEYEE